MNETERVHPNVNRREHHRGFIYYLLAQFPQVLTNVETVVRLALHHDDESEHFLELFRFHPDYTAIDEAQLKTPIVLSDEEKLLFEQLRASYAEYQKLEAKPVPQKGPEPILGRSRGKGSPHFREHNHVTDWSNE